jgi:anti-sigma regulatory factor (Ser/Thr protein kinase)
MEKTYAKSKPIREFIVLNVEEHPSDISIFTATKFSISRQAVHRHIDILVNNGVLTFSGATRNRKYFLVPIADFTKGYKLKELAEDKVWREDISPLLKDIPSNIFSICQYGFTEMVNNAIDHSDGIKITIHILHTATKVEINVIDDGIGIFNRIQKELGLDDPLHAILELSKGKLTTDPKHHTGEGIFFTSRMFDKFSILSGKLFFAHLRKQDRLDGKDWLLEDKDVALNGTSITMEIWVNSLQSTQEIFNRYTADDDYGFSKTHVPVFLARYGNENLVSRSQAKRLLTRFERFKEIVLDFQDIETIGQAFADEIFRVFRNEHPNINLLPINANEDVMKMVLRAINNSNENSGN